MAVTGPHPAPGDHGSATVWVLTAGTVLGGAGLVVTILLGVVVAHRRTVVAADLAALSGAAWVVGAPAAACTEAASVARENRARLVACEVRGATVTVTVAGERPSGILPMLLVPETRATARAGVPVPPVSG